MATVGEVTVKISADLASLRSAYAEAQKATAQLDKSLNASAKSAGAVFGQQWTTNFNQVSASVNSATANIGQLSSVFSKAGSGASGFGDQVKKTSDAMKVFGDTEKQINNATRNLTFQFNDVFSGLASGIPVTQVFAQQITQITQLLKPGTGLVAALSGLGSALVSFFINPINLAVVAIGAATIAIPKLWDAFVGGNAETAEDLLTRVKDLLNDIKDISPEVAKNISAIANQTSQPRTLLEAYNLTQDLGSALSKTRGELVNLTDTLAKAASSQASAQSALGIISADEAARVEKYSQYLITLSNNLYSGQISAQAFSDALARMAIDPNVPENIKAIIDQLSPGSVEAGKLEAALKAAGVAVNSFSNTVYNSFGFDWHSLLNVDGFNAAVKEITSKDFFNVNDKLNELRSQELGVSAIPTPGQRPNQESIAPTRTSSRGAASAWRNENTIENLQKENASIQQQIALYGQEYDVRQKGLLQLQTEEKIRAAIRSLGPKATQEQIAAVTQQITLQQQLNNELRAAQAVASLKESNADLQKEIQLYTLSYEERMKGLAALEAEQKIRQLGIASNSTYANQIREEIALEQQRRGELAQTKAIQQSIDNIYTTMGSTAGGALKGLIDGTKSWNEALGDIIVSLTKAVLQASLLQTFGNGQGGLTSAGGFLSAIVGAFDTGGYTGNGGKYEPAGIVHKGEYVFSKEATNRLGAANLDAMHQAAKRGYAAGGMVASGIGVNNYGVSQRSGSIGAGNRTRGGEEITVRSYFDDNGNFKTAVERIAKPVSQQVSSEQIGQFNTVLPDRIRQIDNNPRRR